MVGKCPRCETMEDLLETARIQVEHARREAEKADDEALHWKSVAEDASFALHRQSYDLMKTYQARAEAAEAKLAEAQNDRA